MLLSREEAGSNEIERYNHPLLLTVLHPAPEGVTQFYDGFALELKRQLEGLKLMENAIVYTSEQLHITVATLESNKQGEIDADKMIDVASSWKALLSKKVPESQGRNRIRLQLAGATIFNDGVGVLLWKEGSNETIRKLRKEIRTAQVALNNGESRTASHIPNIIHSTVLRWKQPLSKHSIGVPMETIRDMFEKTFAQVGTGEVVAELTDLTILEECAPCAVRTKRHFMFDTISCTCT